MRKEARAPRGEATRLRQPFEHHRMASSLPKCLRNLPRAANHGPALSPPPELRLLGGSIDSPSLVEASRIASPPARRDIEVIPPSSVPGLAAIITASPFFI